MGIWSRRSFVMASFASVSTPVWSQSNVNSEDTTEIEQEITKSQRHNLSSFRALDWRPYFSNLKAQAGGLHHLCLKETPIGQNLCHLAQTTHWALMLCI